MSKVILLGAGASKSYSESRTRVRMPISNDFFTTFRKLEISENPWVLIGNLMDYIVEYKKIKLKDLDSFNGDIEMLHSEIQEKLYDTLRINKNQFVSQKGMLFFKAYNELLYLFISVINEVQNGSTSKAHINLVKQLNEHDSIITFNWDTLMDRALKETTNWTTQYGYFKIPNSIYQDKWIPVDKNNEHIINYPMILKLHGSSNWLTSHTIPENGKFELTQEIFVNEFFVFESNIKPYCCYAGRYMDGYQDFSYGYYPPNLPIKGKKAPEGMLISRFRLESSIMPKGLSNSNGLVSMPLIIPPVKNKEYSQFGNLFDSIWKEAKKKLIEANEIYIIGYSFPKTDYRSTILFKSAFIERKDMPNIIIVNPSPEPIVERFIYEFGITKDKLIIHKGYFTEKFELS